MDSPTPTQETKPATRNLVIDGPPTWIVTIVFAGLLAISWGRSEPGAGLAVFAVGMVVALGASTTLGHVQRQGGSDAPLRFTGTPRPPPAERPHRVP